MSKVVYKARKNTNSMKWDGIEEKFGDENLLALWIADMDFEAPDCVKDALRKYVDDGLFGYYKVPESYKEAFISWEEKHHNYKVEKEWIRFSPGVVSGFNWLIHMLTEEGDAVIVNTPVYYPFFEGVVNNNRKLITSPLIRGEQGYAIDYEDFEAKVVENHVKLFIFCTPHNPVGRVWKQEEIVRIMDICKKHNVYVLSDEIHQDIIMSGNQQIPTAICGDYDEILITLTAASKTFNLATCQNSIIIIPDKKLRGMYDAYLTRLRVKGGNAFGYIAVQSAYEHGEEWLKEVLEIIEGNYIYVKETLEKSLPEVRIASLEGTYLMWINLGAYIAPEDMEEVIQKRCGLAVDYGSWFGDDAYACYIRVNLATKKENIVEAVSRLIQVLKR